MAKKFTIRTKGKNYTWGPQIIKLEKKCFGWHCEGREQKEVDDGYEATDHGSYISVKHKTKLIKTIYFSRPTDYKKNFLFSLLELISNIISFFRVWALNIILIPIIICVIAALGEANSADGFIKIIAIIYGSLILGSIVVALLGLLVRRVFKLDQKTDDYYQANGYQKWTEYEEAE